MIPVETLHADRLWGRGRLVQLLTRAWCRMRGHRWRDWWYDGDDYHFNMPRASEPLTWMRGCHRDCGVVQTATATLLQRGGLPS